MRSFTTVLKFDYLQRIRSYAFLITVCATLAIAYTFVPEPNASYATISVANHTGYYNSAWFGYVTAIMTSIFLSLFGFYLVNNGISRDISTKVGQIVATTRVSNFKYLCTKAISNFLILGTIAFLSFVMSIVLFWIYRDTYPFQLFQFIKPYAVITLPALFFISILAVVFEVVLGRFSTLQNIIFFLLFSFMAFSMPNKSTNYALDVLGSQIVIEHMERVVHRLMPADKDTSLTIGYLLKSNLATKKFEFNGLEFPDSFIGSRMLWMLFGMGIVGAVSPFFHRFTARQRSSRKVTPKILNQQERSTAISIGSLQKPTLQYGIVHLLKTELLLLLRKGNKWLWVLNLIAMILLMVLPLDIAYQMVIPILWFLQVDRLSDLTSKDIISKVYYFAFSAYKPLIRVLTSQLMAGGIVLIALTLPLLLRLMILEQLESVLSLLLGALLVVMVAALVGILTKGKKLFEVLFFLVTYANINSIPFLDYYGATGSNIPLALGGVLLLVVCTYFLKRRDLVIL